jgi:hypothetical protein
MRYLRPQTGLAILLTLTLGCGGSDDNGTGPNGISPALVSGIWDLNAPGCLFNQSLPLRLNAADDGTLTSAENVWTYPGAQFEFDRPLDGRVDLETGTAEFHIWSSEFRTAALLFVGTLSADGSLTGVITDPLPGYIPVFHFFLFPICQAQASGQRR